MYTDLSIHINCFFFFPTTAKKTNQYITTMFVLFETAAGYALFKVSDEGKLNTPENIWSEFSTPEKAKKA